MLKAKHLKKNQATKLLNFRCTDAELAEMQKNADLYTDGNLSAWIRFSSIELKPHKKHIDQK